MSKPHIELITPITSDVSDVDSWVEGFELPGFTLGNVGLDAGPASIENSYEEALSVPDILTKAARSEAQGAAGIVINCMGDPGLAATRELVSIPVLGPAETSLHLAATLGRRIGSLNVLSSVKPCVEKLVAIYGVKEQFASFRSVDIPVLEIDKDPAATHQHLLQCALSAICEDGADVLILNCTGFTGMAQGLMKDLAGRGYPVPVIDPLPLTIRTLAVLIQQGLCHSKHTYRSPDHSKPLPGYNLL